MAAFGGGTRTAEAVYLAAFSLNTAAGGAIYLLAAVAAILLACFAAAQRLLPAAGADAVATASLLQLAGAALVVLAFVASAVIASRRGADPLDFPWALALAVAAAALAAVLALGLLPYSSPLAALQSSSATAADAVAWSGSVGTVGSDAVAAAVLAGAAVLGAGMDYATGALRADRTGAVASMAACAAVVAAAVFFVVVQLDRLFGAAAAVGGATAVLVAFFASSWLGARVADLVAGHRSTPVVASSLATDKAARHTKAVVSIAMVLAAVLPPVLLYASGALGSVARGGPLAAEREQDVRELVAVGLALLCWLPVVAAVAAAALRLRSLAPYVYSVLAASVLAAAVFSAGLLVPWNAGLLWLGIFAAFASFANMSIRGPDGGQRRLAVALMLAAGFAASQVFGNKLLSLLPAALVAFALWKTGRSVAPAAIFAGAVIWSVVDDAGTAPAGADPATLVGRTAATLAAVTIVAAEVYHAADANLQFALSGLGLFSLYQTRLALGLGRVLLAALLSMLSRDAVRGLMKR
jgi:hypothetical protein